MNYDNINDIFAAGVTNMTCLLQDSNNYDSGTLAVSGADFFTFLGKSAPSIVRLSMKQPPAMLVE